MRGPCAGRGGPSGRWRKNGSLTQPCHARPEHSRVNPRRGCPRPGWRRGPDGRRMEARGGARPDRPAPPRWRSSRSARPTSEVFALGACPYPCTSPATTQPWEPVNRAPAGPSPRNRSRKPGAAGSTATGLPSRTDAHPRGSTGRERSTPGGAFVHRPTPSTVLSFHPSALTPVRPSICPLLPGRCGARCPGTRGRRAVATEFAGSMTTEYANAERGNSEEHGDAPGRAGRGRPSFPAVTLRHAPVPPGLGQMTPRRPNRAAWKPVVRVQGGAMNRQIRIRTVRRPTSGREVKMEIDRRTPSGRILPY